MVIFCKPAMGNEIGISFDLEIDNKIDTAPSAPSAPSTTPTEEGPQAQVVNLNAEDLAYYSGLPVKHEPIAGGYITSGFGWRVHPVYGTHRFHGGVDWCDGDGCYGDPVYAIGSPGDTLEIICWFNDAGGGLVATQITNGDENIRDDHLHLSGCSEGIYEWEPQLVVGRMGNSGVGTDAHLHYQRRVGVNRDKVEPQRRHLIAAITGEAVKGEASIPPVLVAAAEEPEVFPEVEEQNLALSFSLANDPPVVASSATVAQLDTKTKNELNTQRNTAAIVDIDVPSTPPPEQISEPVDVVFEVDTNSEVETAQTVGTTTVSTAPAEEPSNVSSNDETYSLEAALDSDGDGVYDSNSLVAIAIGNAEGTRGVYGEKNQYWDWHVDPGNQAINLGTFSYQHCTPTGRFTTNPAVINCTPEQADERQLNRLKGQAERIKAIAASYGMTLTLEEMVSAMDLANQSPAAVFDRGFISRLYEVKGWGRTGWDAIVEARVRSYLHPDTGRWSAPGLGNTENGVRRDQERRTNAIKAAMEANPQLVERVRSGLQLEPTQIEQTTEQIIQTDVEEVKPEEEKEFGLSF